MKIVLNDKFYGKSLKDDKYILLNLDSIDQKNICICEYYNNQNKYYSKEYVLISHKSHIDNEPDIFNKVISIKNIIYIDFDNNQIMLSKYEELFIMRKDVFYKIIENINGKSYMSGYYLKILNENIDINTKNIYMENINDKVQPLWYKGNVYLTI